MVNWILGIIEHAIPLSNYKPSLRACEVIEWNFQVNFHS
jgi:hypothetical protein